MEPWESGSWAGLMFSDSTANLYRDENIPTEAYEKNTGEFSNMSQWLQWRFHSLTPPLQSFSTSKAIPSYSNTNSVPRISITTFFTCFQHLFQVFTANWKAGVGFCKQLKEQDALLCHFHRMGMAQFESLSSLLFMKHALSHTPTILLSQIISLLTFKLKN